MKIKNILPIKLLLISPLQAAIEKNMVSMVSSEDLAKAHIVKNTSILSIIPPLILGTAAALTAILGAIEIYKGAYGFKCGFEKTKFSNMEVWKNGICTVNERSTEKYLEKDSEQVIMHTIKGGLFLILSSIFLKYTINNFKARAAAKKAQLLSQSPARTIKV